MSDELDEMIEKYRGEDGKLTCASAFKVASKQLIFQFQLVIWGSLVHSL